MGIGELYKIKNFNTTELALRYMYKIAPTLTKSNDPIDLLHHENDSHFINVKYYDLLEEYFKKYITVREERVHSLQASALAHIIVQDLKKKGVKLPPKYSGAYESFTQHSDPIADMGITLKRHLRQGLNRFQLSDGVGALAYRHLHGLHYFEIDFYGRPPERVVEFIKKYIGEEYFSRIGTRVHAMHTICTAIVKKEYVQIFEDVMNFNEGLNEKFSQESDPVKDMGIGHDEQMKKLDVNIRWDWKPDHSKGYFEDQIIDIVQYNKKYNYWIKVSKITRITPDVKNMNFKTREFYLATSNVGEPYDTDPEGQKTPAAAFKREKNWLDGYIDSL